ncbi:MAG: ABC transporter ATP-binding protein, partial [Burkholderiaceae bacterium]
LDATTSDGGTIWLDGRPLSNWTPAELARRRAFLPQGRADAFGHAALDTVLMARHARTAGRIWDTPVDVAAARAALTAMDAERFAARDVRTLSGGERQRVALAALLAQEAPLLLLDEPATALDLAHQVRLMRHLSTLCRGRGNLAVMAGHDLNLAREAATHALLLMDGGDWLAGPVADVMQPDALARCLGHPVEMIVHDGRTLFVPRAESGAI